MIQAAAAVTLEKVVPQRDIVKCEQCGHECLTPYWNQRMKDPLVVIKGLLYL